MDSCPTLQAAVAGNMAVDNNKSACCALGGAAQAPRAVDILTLSKVLASTTSSSGVRIRTRHTAHALPDKFDVVCSRHLNEQRSSYPTSWASLGQLGGLPRQAFGVDATRGLQASYTRLGAVAAAGLPRFRFDAADWLRGQATAERAYAFACAYVCVCLVSAVRTRSCIKTGNPS